MQQEDEIMEDEEVPSTSQQAEKLTNEDIERYSRQLILPGFGVACQLKLKKTSFLIVGMGGLGCPAAQYLVAAGAGRVGMIDYDYVERSNFHRQTLHVEKRIGMSKVQSAKEALLAINPHCEIEVHATIINSINGTDLVGEYDVILDCTDNVATRYLLNDACVLMKKPLVSGSALQWDGQLTVYNYGELCPCYRCLFPVPPPPESVQNCGDGGVMGAVTGTIGSLQALEAIKVATNVGDALAGRLLIFDGLHSVFRNIKLRPRRTDCDVCGLKPFITRLIDYEQFCGMPASDKNYNISILPVTQRYSVRGYKGVMDNEKDHLLLDVRQPAEFEICSLPHSINVPLKRILDDSYLEMFKEQLEKPDYKIFMICRRGNDSQLAVSHMRNRFPQHQIYDVKGGLHDWHRYIDRSFPKY